MKAGNFVQDHPVPIAAAVLVLLSAGALAIGVPLGRITEVAIYLLYGAGVNLLVGYTGLVPFGASVFFGVASYVAALFALHVWGVELGGLAMVFPGFDSFMSQPPASSEQLAAEWRPYIETCIEAFGPKRCMFESNFPVDIGSCTYDVLWNAFKVLAKGASAEEKAALFSGTATEVYRLNLA